LHLNETEGRAQLIAKAKPYLDRLPDSVFKGLMFARLKSISGSSELGYLESPAGHESHSHHVRSPDKSRLSSARVALALLLQNPGLIDRLQSQNKVWEALEFPGSVLFKSLSRLLAEKNRPTPQ